MNQQKKKKSWAQQQIDKWEEWLREQEGVEDKYHHPGIYSISIEDKLVYIGKSRNMLRRLAEHLYEICDNRYIKCNKYKVLRKAYFQGLNVNFDVINVLQEQDDYYLSVLEALEINRQHPPLNYQIPKPQNPKSYTINKKASYITLEEII